MGITGVLSLLLPAADHVQKSKEGKASEREMEEVRSKDRRPDPVETMAFDRTLAFTWGRWYEPGELGFVL